MKNLKVNIPKTKVVFKKGPVARNEHWTFGGQRLEVVNYFIYLGTLSFNRMTIDQATKAKRVLISLLNSLYNLGQLLKNGFLKTI